MSPNSLLQISERRYALILASYSLAVAVLVGLLPFLLTVDAQGRRISIGLAAFFGLIAAWRFFVAFRSSPTEPQFQGVQNAPPELQVAYYRRMIWVTALAFPALTALTAWQLSKLESGTTKNVRIWAPLAFLYDHVGFAPTVAAIPALGLVCVWVFVHKLRQQRKGPP